MFAYRTHAEKKSLYNTPPVFPIYVVSLVLEWIQESGGLAAVESRNRQKADAVYAVIDGDADFLPGHRASGQPKLDERDISVAVRGAGNVLHHRGE